MATTAPTLPAPPRDAAAFGGFIPGSAVARSAETLVAALGIEHHTDGAVVTLLVLSEAPGTLDWDPALGLSIRDERGERYEARTIVSATSLGQLEVALWMTPPVPANVRRLELVVDGLARVNPARGGGPGIARPLSDGPWNVIVELVPDRTVATVPPEPGRAVLNAPTGSVPIRAHGTFLDVVPVGQAQLGPDVVVGVLSLERYWDRSVASLVALGGADDAPPVIGRADLEVWDDLGRRYQAIPFQGATGDTWSAVCVEITPAIPPDATTLAVRVGDLPRGGDGAREVGPFTFGIRLPAG